SETRKLAAMSRFPNFAESPFGPLCEHMEQVKACVALISPMFESALAQRWDELAERTSLVFKLEHEADKIKNEIRDVMPRTFALPIFRGDLLAYLKLQDDMADTVEDVAVVLTLKQLTLPESLVGELQIYVEKVVAVCDKLFRCTDQLADLKESDLSSQRTKDILALVAEAEHAEWVADKQEYTLSKALFAAEDKIKPTDIYLWSKVFMELGKLANHADKTAERLRRMIGR
ncbi:MAG: TIGR00153 family protein, partial [Planctomycetota bacterium]